MPYAYIPLNQNEILNKIKIQKQKIQINNIKVCKH